MSTGAHLRWVVVADRPVNVVDIGEGPVVVFLHGLAGCWQNWLENIPDLARDHRVIALDLPGFGASPMPAQPISRLFFGPGWLASRSDRVVRSERLRRALLMLVATYPERLPSRLIAEQAHGAGKPGFRDAREAMTGYPIRDRLGEIACPALIVWGELDRLVPLRDAHEGLIPQARKLVCADTGHLVMLERPARFNADLRAFLAEGPGEQRQWSAET